MATRIRNQRGEGERLRESLLDAASELLAESRDAEGLSVRAVTARAGVSPTALYLHFADKDELTRAVKHRAFDELGAALLAAQAERAPTTSGGAGASLLGDHAQQVRAMGIAYLRFARERPGVYAILFQTHIPQKPPAPTTDDIGTGDEVFRILVAAVERSLPDGRDAFEISCVLWMALHGRAAVRTAMPNFPFPDDERFVSLLVERVLGV
jgi:AcrR family transcriptional regulator